MAELEGQPFIWSLDRPKARQRAEREILPPLAKNMREVYLDALDELVKPMPSIKLPNWDHWSRATGGFRPREFSIFCGSTGAGKTTFMANISAQLLRQREKHFVMSVETGHTDYMKRILSVLAGRDLNTGDPVAVETLTKLHVDHADVLESGNIEFSLYEDRLPVEQLMSDLRFMVKTRGCKVAIIDNLNFFLEVTKSSELILEMDRVIHELIIFCKQVDVHIIMVMHPKKSDGKSTRVESEYDIKGSSTAVQEAHNVFLFNRPRQEDIDNKVRNPSDRELKIAKMRRRGGYAGRTIVFNCFGTKYTEEGLL
jgi:twinkle protein